MKTTLRCLALAFAAGLANPAAASLEQLAWLTGCWKADNAEAGSGEQWTSAAGGSLFGIGRTVRGGKAVAWEFMRIAPGEQGQLTFFAAPSGQKPASFVVKAQDAQGIVFENLAHDFPHRIVYRLEAPGRLRAAIEGLRNGQPRTIEYPMTRTACDA